MFKFDFSDDSPEGRFLKVKRMIERADIGSEVVVAAIRVLVRAASAKSASGFAGGISKAILQSQTPPDSLARDHEELSLENRMAEPRVYNWATEDLRAAGVPEHVMEEIDASLREMLDAPKIPDTRRPSR